MKCAIWIFNQNEELNENDYENKNDNNGIDADGVNGDECSN